MTTQPEGALMRVEPPQSEQSMLVLIDRAARDQNVDIAKMERLLELAEKIHLRESKAHYDQAMNVAQGEMRPISRDCHNPQTRSRYASYEAIDNAIRPIYTAHGFAMSFGSKAASNQDRVMVTCRISHRAGHAEYVEVEMPADGKGAKGGDVMTKTHAVGSALSYGKRYLVNLIWNLSFGESEDDGNAASPRPPQTQRRAYKTPENRPSAPKQATPESSGPKKATEARRKGVLEFLRKSFPEPELMAFATNRRFVKVGDAMEDWNLADIPVSNTDLNALKIDIEKWLEGSEPPKDMPDGQELPEFFDTPIHIPRKGQRLADYAVNQDTIRSLYLAGKAGDLESANRLFGFVENFEPKPYKGNPPSQQDFDLRVALDQFKAWRQEKEENESAETVSTVAPDDDVPF